MFVIHGPFGHLSIKSLSWGDLSVRLAWAFYVMPNPQVAENCLSMLLSIPVLGYRIDREEI